MHSFDGLSNVILSRKQYGPAKPLKGARIAGCLHMTVQVSTCQKPDRVEKSPVREE